MAEEKKMKEKKYSSIQVEKKTYEALGDACEKVSDMVGFRVSKSKLVAILTSGHLGSVVKRYETACARLRAEKLL